MPTIDCLLPWADIGINTFRGEFTRHCNHGMANSCQGGLSPLRVFTCHHEAAVQTEHLASGDGVLPTTGAVHSCTVAARQHPRERPRSEPAADCSGRPLLLDRTRVGEHPDLIGDVDSGGWRAPVLKTSAPASTFDPPFP